jgi:hypothetical protein
LQPSSEGRNSFQNAAPAAFFHSLRDEDQTIFNVLLTGSGHMQQQQMVTGLSGSGSVREVYDQIGVENRDVREYVRGLEPQDRVTRI